MILRLLRKREVAKEGGALGHAPTVPGDGPRRTQVHPLDPDTEQASHPEAEREAEGVKVVPALLRTHFVAPTSSVCSTHC